MKPRKCKQKRNLSAHVCSRFNRAPEVCLLEKQYDQAMDMWSIGVVIYDLVLYMVSDQETFEKNKTMFKGGSCYPLSPKRENRKEIEDDD